MNSFNCRIIKKDGTIIEGDKTFDGKEFNRLMEEQKIKQKKEINSDPKINELLELCYLNLKKELIEGLLTSKQENEIKLILIEIENELMKE